MMYNYGYSDYRQGGFRGERSGGEQTSREKRERRVFISGIFLLLAAMLGFGAGVFLYQRPGGDAALPGDELLQRLTSGILCGFFGDGVSLWAAAQSYLWIVCPLLLLAVSVFGALTLPYSLVLLAVKGFFSGFTCAALLDLRSPGAGGILCFILFLLTEGAILLLTLSFAREGLLFREETKAVSCSGIPKQQLKQQLQKKLQTFLLDLLFLCGALLLLFLLRGILCSFF